jgi:outer membrane receptor protein involved in Fe transport
LNLSLGYGYGRQLLTDHLYFIAPSMPEHTVHLGADWRVTKNVSLNAHSYYVADWYDGASTVDSYVRLDLGLRWKINENCELALWGQNLLDEQHPESSRGSLEGYGDTTEIGRSAYLQFTYHF